MEDFDLQAVASKSLKGFSALTSRTFLIKVLSIVTSFVLTSILSKQDFGIYFIASSIVVFLVYFQDIGLAASLIQKKEEPTLEEYRATFTVQQLLVLILVVICFIFSTKIVGFYHLDSQGTLLFFSLVISFFISSLKTIPTVMLERHLLFNKLVVPDIVENLVYNVVLIVMALMHYGITSFSIAILARSIIGLFVIYYIQPWRLGISFHFKTIKDLFGFGIPLQANSLLSLLKDNLVNLYIGKVLSHGDVGIIGFAQKLSFLPSNLIMDNVVRITFPAYSRLQHSKESLKIIIEQSLFLISACVFPLVIGFMMFSHSFIVYVPIPGYTKWIPAVISIFYFSLNILFASITVPLTNFLNAIGKVKVTLYSMVFLTVLTWILTPLFIHYYGYNGVSLASFIVAASLLVVLPFTKQYVTYSFWRPLIKPFLAAALMMGFSYLIQPLIVNFLLFIMFASIAVGVYAAILYIISQEELRKTLEFLKIKK